MAGGYRTLGMDTNIFRDVYTGVSTEFQQAMDRLGDQGVHSLLTTRIPMTGYKERFPFAFLTSQIRKFEGTRAARQIGADDYYITYTKWEHTLAIDEDDILNNSLGWLPAMAGELAAQAQLHKDQRLATIFNEHMAGSLSESVNGFDATTLFSATHAWNSGYTTAQSNLLSGSGNGTIDGSGDADVIKNAINTARNWKGPDGYRIGFKPTHIFCALNIEDYFYRAFGSPTLIAGTNTAEATNYNTLVRYGMQIVPFADLTDGYWAIADLSKPIKPFLFADRTGVELSDTKGGDDHFNTDQYKIGLKVRYEMVPGMWTRIIGGNAT